MDVEQSTGLWLPALEFWDFWGGPPENGPAPSIQFLSLATTVQLGSIVRVSSATWGTQHDNAFIFPVCGPQIGASRATTSCSRSIFAPFKWGGAKCGKLGPIALYTPMERAHGKEGGSKVEASEFPARWASLFASFSPSHSFHPQTHPWFRFLWTAPPCPVCHVLALATFGRNWAELRRKEWSTYKDRQWTGGSSRRQANGR